MPKVKSKAYSFEGAKNHPMKVYPDTDSFKESISPQKSHKQSLSVNVTF